MDKITIAQIDTASPEYVEVFELRDELLRKPLGMSLKNDDLSRDHTDIILVAKQNNKVVGCLMLHHKDEANVQLRQMAVAGELQGTGVGRVIVTAAEQLAAEKGYKTMVLHARKVAVGFYDRLGYAAISEEFMEVGIPHFIMEKTLL
jgi:predicted GNAT family N-acyltransferase